MHGASYECYLPFCQLPVHHCGFCLPAGPTELTAYSDRHDEFVAMNAQVLGVSVDSQFAHLQWTRQPRNEGEHSTQAGRPLRGGEVPVSAWVTSYETKPPALTGHFLMQASSGGSQESVGQQACDES